MESSTNKFQLKFKKKKKYVHTEFFFHIFAFTYKEFEIAEYEIPNHLDEKKMWFSVGKEKRIINYNFQTVYLKESTYSVMNNEKYQSKCGIIMKNGKIKQNSKLKSQKFHRLFHLLFLE